MNRSLAIALLLTGGIAHAETAQTLSGLSAAAQIRPKESLDHGFDGVTFDGFKQAVEASKRPVLKAPEIKSEKGALVQVYGRKVERPGRGPFDWGLFATLAGSLVGGVLFMFSAIALLGWWGGMAATFGAFILASWVADGGIGRVGRGIKRALSRRKARRAADKAASH